MQKRILSSLLLCILYNFASAQCPTVTYTLPDSVCSGESFSVFANGDTSSNYQWDFCAGEIFDPPQIFPLLSGAASAGGSDIVEDNGNYHIFVVNNLTLSRYDFGNSLSNTPVYTNINTLGGLLNGASDITLKKEGGNWYGFVNRFNDFIIRLNFGNSLTNIPSGQALTVPADSLGFPFYHTFAYDNGNHYMITGNFVTSSITVINFGNSITNTAPTTRRYSIPGGNVLGISVVKDCDQWYGFTTHSNSIVIDKIDFGNSLDNVPSAITAVTPTGNPSATRQYEMIRENEVWYGVGVDLGGGILKRFDWGDDLNNTPVYSATPGYTGVNGDRALSLEKYGSQYFGTVTNNANGNLRLFTYADNCSSTPSVSDSLAPQSVTYSSGGWNFVNLNIIDSAGHCEQIVDSIFVLSAPDPAYVFDKACSGEPVNFTDSSTINGSTISSWFWEFGDGDTSIVQNPSHLYDSVGAYQITLTAVSAAGCVGKLTDSISVNVLPVADFVFSDSACGNLGVQFIDSSSSQSGTISQWGWIFGDQNFDTLQNPVHLYDSMGVFNVQLFATDNSGCQDDTLKSITILAAPKADFSFDNTCVNRPASVYQSNRHELQCDRILLMEFWRQQYRSRCKCH